MKVVLLGVFMFVVGVTVGVVWALRVRDFPVVLGMAVVLCLLFVVLFAEGAVSVRTGDQRLVRRGRRLVLASLPLLGVVPAVLVAWQLEGDAVADVMQYAEAIAAVVDAYYEREGVYPDRETLREIRDGIRPVPERVALLLFVVNATRSGYMCSVPDSRRGMLTFHVRGSASRKWSLYTY